MQQTFLQITYNNIDFLLWHNINTINTLKILNKNDCRVMDCWNIQSAPGKAGFVIENDQSESLKDPPLQSATAAFTPLATR